MRKTHYFSTSKMIKQPTKKIKTEINKLNEEQEEALTEISNGSNILITGPAGTGKSYLLKKAIEKMKRSGKKVVCTATSWMAARQISVDTPTINSFAGIGICDKSAVEIIKDISRKEYIKKNWKSCDVLIIDEIGNMNINTFKTLIIIAREFGKDNSKSFGGIQLICCGDFAQLKSISDDESATSSGFLFHCREWQETINKIVYLNNIQRQSNVAFSTLLNRIRLGNVTNSDISNLKSRLNYTLEIPAGGIVTWLYPTNDRVNQKNSEELNNLEGEINTYKIEYQVTNISTSNANKLLSINKKKLSFLQDQIDLKVGAEVVLTVTLDVSLGLTNGTLGRVIRFEESSCYPIPIIRFNGCTVDLPITKYRYTIDDFQGKKNDSVTVIQLPIQLAFAMTIHRCIGMTLDYVYLYADGLFEYGQFYTGISRLRSFNRLSFTAFNPESIKVHDDVKMFYSDDVLFVELDEEFVDEFTINHG